MREIAMITSRDAEHAHEVEDRAKKDRGGINAGDKDGEASDV